jgi:hypothetical protein
MREEHMSLFRSILVNATCSLAAVAALSSAPAFAGAVMQQPALTTVPAVTPGLFPTCASYCAAINADGSIARAHNLTTSAHLGTGVYQVLFYSSVTAQKNISKCVWLATPGYNIFGGVLGPTFLTLAGRSGTTNGVFIITYNPAGTPVDTPFLLEISC